MNASRLPDGQVAVTFTYDEAVVLSHLLSRMETRELWDQVPFEDQAEQRVIWDLTATFEPLIDEVFGDAYGEALDHARAALRDPAS